MTLTIEQLAYWQGYFDQLKPLMRLTDWRITLSADPCHEGADASAWISKDYHSSTFYLASDWDEKSVQDQRSGIVHELAHAIAPFLPLPPAIEPESEVAA